MTVIYSEGASNQMRYKGGCTKLQKWLPETEYNKKRKLVFTSMQHIRPMLLECENSNFINTPPQYLSCVCFAWCSPFVLDTSRKKNALGRNRSTPPTGRRAPLRSVVRPSKRPGMLQTRVKPLETSKRLNCREKRTIITAYATRSNPDLWGRRWVLTAVWGAGRHAFIMVTKSYCYHISVLFLYSCTQLGNVAIAEVLVGIHG